MIDDVTFVPSDVTLSNLSAIAKAGFITSERRVCEIFELASYAVRFSLDLYAAGMGVYEILSLISDGLSTGFDTDFGDDALALAKAYPSFIGTSDRAEFARLYVKEMREAGVTIDEFVLLNEPIKDKSVVYVKNSLADEAYDVLTQEIKDLRVSYAAGFKEAADAVTSMSSTFCLLPLEEQRGTRLSSISDILYRRDFKINAVTSVFGFDGNADMKYALLSASFVVPTILRDDDGYFEIRIKDEGDLALSEILSVADCYGISLYRVSTERFENEGELSTYYSIVFKNTGGGFTDLIVYLTLFSSDFVPIGMYKNLE